MDIRHSEQEIITEHYLVRHMYSRISDEIIHCRI